MLRYCTVTKEKYMFKIKQDNSGTLKSFVNAHGNFITIIVAVVVFIGGIGVVQGESQWWLTALAIVILLLLLFILKNARVVIKAALTILISFYSAFFALQIGTVANPFETYGLVWMTTQILLFTSCIFVSYMIFGHQSRWTATSLGVIVSFLSAILLLTESVNFVIAIISGTVLGFFVFLAFYRLKGHWLSKKSKMPKILLDDKHLSILKSIAEENNWNYRTVSVLFQKIPSFIVWNDTKSFVLIPVHLDQKFGITGGKKRTSIAYQTNSINNWAKSLTFRMIPQWRSKFADSMLILLDTTAANGFVPKTIGLSIPDSNKKIPVGIYPAKNMFSENRKTDGVLDDISEKYGKFIADLTNSQKKALSDLDSSSEYIEDASLVEILKEAQN